MSDIIPFDDTRAKTYVRAALSLMLPSNEPVLYFKGSWAGNPGKAVDDDLATLLQKGLPEATGEMLATPSPAGHPFIRKGLHGLGFGAQLMADKHFVMASGPGDVYGCAPNNEDGSLPLAYQRALDNDAIGAAMEVFRNRGFNPVQMQGIRFALESLGVKVAPVQAYTVTQDDLAQGTVIQTVLKGKVEAESRPNVGDWYVKQKNGETQLITAGAWARLGYIEWPPTP